jgi:hypothetical protein
LLKARTLRVRSFIQSKVHIESEKGRAAQLTAIEILMQNNCTKAAINFVCLAGKDEGSSALAKLKDRVPAGLNARGNSWRYRAKGTLGSAMTIMDRLEHDFGRILSGPDIRRHVVGRMVSANRLDADDGTPIAPADDNALKRRLREELLLQAQTRLPITYARLAESMVGSDETGVIRDALEQLMDDDADEGLPMLAAVAVKALEPGLPAPWFFRKAEGMGLFAGDPADLEAYAFHAREFYRAIRLHAGLSHDGQGSGKALPAVLPSTDR